MAAYWIAWNLRWGKYASSFRVILLSTQWKSCQGVDAALLVFTRRDGAARTCPLSCSWSIFPDTGGPLIREERAQFYVQQWPIRGEWTYTFRRHSLTIGLFKTGEFLIIQLSADFLAAGMTRLPPQQAYNRLAIMRRIVNVPLVMNPCPDFLATVTGGWHYRCRLLRLYRTQKKWGREEVLEFQCRCCLSVAILSEVLTLQPASTRPTSYNGTDS